jgi:iron complex outermembrane recepter protein
VDYPLEDIERIEVIRGSGAGVWGANAVNGIINVITKSARDTQGGLATVGGGTEERAFGSVRYGGRRGDDLYYRVYLKGFSRDEQFAASGDPHDGWWGASGGSRLDWRASDGDTVTFDAGYARSDAGRRDSRPMIAAPFVFGNREDELSRAAHLLARWSHGSEKERRWSLQAYWDRFRRIFEGLDVQQRWDTYDLDFQHQLPRGERNTIVCGVGYGVLDSHLGNSESDHGFILSYVPNDSRQQLFSAFVQDEVALLADKSRVTLGAKGEHNDFTGFELQPTARLLWTPTKSQTIWAAVSRAVRTPSVADDELRSTLLQGTPGVGPFPQTTGNPGLESEQLRALEAGYRAQASSALSLDAAVFYDHYDKLRIQVPGTVFVNALGAAIRPQVRHNGMRGEAYGSELAATWQPSTSWRLYGAYTFLRLNLRADPSLPTATRTGSEAAEGQSPRHQVYLQSSWNLPGSVGSAAWRF